MPILSAFTSLPEFLALAGLMGNARDPFTESGTAAELAPHVARGLRADGTVRLPLYFGPPRDEVFLSFHFRGTTLTMPLGFELVQIRDAVNDRDLFRLTFVNGTTQSRYLQLEIHDGTGWTDLGITTEPLNRNDLTRFDLHVRLDAADGVFALAMNGTTALSWTGDSLRTPGTKLDSIDTKVWSNSANITCIVSAVIAADEDTRPMQMVQLTPDAAGHYAEMAGTLVAVTGTSTTTATIQASHAIADAPNRRNTYTTPGLPAPFETGHVPLQLQIALMAQRGDAPGSAIRAMIRSTGPGPAIDSFGATEALDTDWGCVLSVFATDPDGDQPWTVDVINALEIGMQSRAL